ncbi:MAG: hypothetical protein M5U12_07575 [Verrucomicrobia bacterium]|nr:hypothetical protein [Verrucomicrobiota bacterium]
MSTLQCQIPKARQSSSLLDRRSFLRLATLGSLGATGSCVHHPRPTQTGRRRPRLLFTSGGKTCLIHADGTGQRTLELDVPDQVTWQPVGVFPDGRLLLLSLEARRDGPGRSFEEYYHQTPTHVWAYDLDRGRWKNSSPNSGWRPSMPRNCSSPTVGSSCRSSAPAPGRSTT